MEELAALPRTTVTFHANALPALKAICGLTHGEGLCQIEEDQLHVVACSTGLYSMRLTLRDEVDIQEAFPTTFNFAFDEFKDVLHTVTANAGGKLVMEIDHGGRVVYLHSLMNELGLVALIQIADPGMFVDAEACFKKWKFDNFASMRISSAGLHGVLDEIIVKSTGLNGVVLIPPVLLDTENQVLKMIDMPVDSTQYDTYTCPVHEDTTNTGRMVRDKIKANPHAIKILGQSSGRVVDVMRKTSDHLTIQYFGGDYPLVLTNYATSPQFQTLVFGHPVTVDKHIDFVRNELPDSYWRDCEYEFPPPESVFKRRGPIPLPPLLQPSVQAIAVRRPPRYSLAAKVLAERNQVFPNAPAVWGATLHEPTDLTSTPRMQGLSVLRRSSVRRSSVRHSRGEFDGDELLREVSEPTSESPDLSFHDSSTLKQSKRHRSADEEEASARRSSWGDLLESPLASSNRTRRDSLGATDTNWSQWHHQGDLRMTESDSPLGAGEAYNFFENDDHHQHLG